MMRRPGWLWLLAAVWLTSGCCPHPGVFDQVRRSLQTVQGFYGDLLTEREWSDQVRQAVVAADTTLLLAGELERQWCPDPAKAAQLELQAQQAGNLAAEAAPQADRAGAAPPGK